MPKCPNCGQETARTKDWACQWCGYPLISKSYKKIQQTFKQVKEERLQQREPKPATIIEHDEKAKQGDMARRDAERLSREQAGLEAREIREIAKQERKEKQQAERLVREKVRQEAIAIKEIDKKTQEVARRQSKGDDEHARLEEEAWKEAMRLSQVQAEKEAEEARERVRWQAEASKKAEKQAKALKVAEAQKEAEKRTQLEEEAWKEAMRLSQVQAEKEAEEARERVRWQAEVNPEPAVDVLELSIDEFSSAFSEDSAAAHEKFTNTILRLTGKVDKVVINEINDNYFVNITGDKKGMILRDVRCKFDKQHATELKELIKGEIARVQGEYNGYVIDISMKNCILVR